VPSAHIKYERDEQRSRSQTAGDRQPRRRRFGRARTFARFGAGPARLLRVTRGQPGDVDDLVQETLIAVHVKRASYDPTRPFGPRLFAVARYKLIDAFRRNRAGVALDSLGDMFGDDRFEADTGARIEIATLLDTLPVKQASAIRGTRIEGWSISETAARDGISESDVKISVHRGVKALMAKRGSRDEYG
jgi:RNA polymerase sigma factor (sigma-70 family)